MAGIATAALIGAGISAAGGIVGGLVGGRKRRREQKAAERELNEMKSRYQALDTSNPYKNVTNTFEDLTVNTQAATFAAQQADQSRANILGDLAASSGGGGIAALAQSLANQQTQAAQAAAASIGQQERQNQVMSAQGEQSMQSMRAQGEAMSQQREMEKTGNLLQMAAGRKAAADQARQDALNTAIGGVVGAGQILAAGAGGGSAGTASSATPNIMANITEADILAPQNNVIAQSSVINGTLKGGGLKKLPVLQPLNQ